MAHNLHVFGHLAYLLYLPLLTAYIFLHVHTTLRNDCLKQCTILRNIVFFLFSLYCKSNITTHITEEMIQCLITKDSRGSSLSSFELWMDKGARNILENVTLIGGRLSESSDHLRSTCTRGDITWTRALQPDLEEVSSWRFCRAQIVSRRTSAPFRSGSVPNTLECFISFSNVYI
jgi:hypothetical protein